MAAEEGNCNVYATGPTLPITCYRPKNLGELEKFLPERAGEDLVPIRHNRVGQAVEFVNVVKEYLGHTSSSKRVSKSQEVTVLGEFINHQQYTSLVLRFWEALDEIHGNHLPSSGGLE